MLITLGYVAMGTAFLLSLSGVVVPWLGLRRNNWNLIRSAQFMSALNLLFVGIASAVLLNAFVNSDFSVRFVWQNSSTDLPLLYQLTAFWGGMEGSLLFWDLVLALFTVIVAFGYQRANRELLPHVLMVINTVHVFLLFLLLTYSNPLALQFPVPLEGRGLNPLLQHPGMAAHPPLLYFGYIGFTIPFAFAVASMLRGRMDNLWVVTTRRWTLFAWYTLTMGMMVGGEWAYEELGWGGFWGWDPVENASFMPWLTGTAFLHSIMLQEKRDMMKVWNVSLIIITFSLSILGTFIVRSGVLNSVHAFAKSEIGPAFLSFAGIVLFSSFILMFRRMKLLESRHTADYLLSKETTFLLNNLLFVGIAFTVFLGTVFPLLAEAIRGTKLSIQAPFFNSIVGPLGTGLLFLIGICTLIAWRKSSPNLFWRNFGAPLGAGVLAGLLAYMAGLTELRVVLIVAAAVFTTYVLVWDYIKAVMVRSRQQKTGFFTSALETISRNQQRYGGMMIHLGVVLLFVGIGGSVMNYETSTTLREGQPHEVGDYVLDYKGISFDRNDNAMLRQAEIDVYMDGELLETLKPAHSFYQTQPEPLNEVAILRRVSEDLYIILAGVNEDESATVRIIINPLMMWAWFAFPMFTLGTMIAMFYRPRRLPQPIHNRGLSPAKGS